jgi:hypothetical protein
MDSGPLYSRELPGGGFVSIEPLTQDEATFRAQVCVERRSDPSRRAGHAPPVIADVSGESQATVFKSLYDIASDNVAIARGLMQWQSKHGGSSEQARQ